MNLPKANQHDGPMAGHVRRGRVFMPPLAATEKFRMENWFKDDLPDLLWPALVLAEQGNGAVRMFVEWQKALQKRLSHHGEPGWVAELLDGRLTNLAALAGKFSDAPAIVANEAESRGLLSAKVRNALASYPDLPARWLAGGVEASPPREQDLEIIEDALLGVIEDGHREALLKCLRICSMVQAGTFRASAETIDLLEDYPVEPSKRTKADSVVRSIWGAHKARKTIEDPDHFDGANRWARAFWETNSMSSRCIRNSEIEDTPDASVEDGQAAPGTSEPAGPTPMPVDGNNLRPFTMDVLSSFIEALESAPADLYVNERQEVVSGLVARAGRDLIAVLGAPDLWCLEHGAHIGRMLVETKIYLQWMAGQDPIIYRQFQEYGAGKAKLYSRILDEIPEEARTAGFREAIKEFRQLSHNDGVLDHRVVDTSDSFANGKSIRKMAEETALLDFYRQTYSIASGVSHSEWWSVEKHAMEPCLNVLHGMHQIPNLSLNYGGNVELAASWVDQFYSLVRTGLQILGTNVDAVAEAFSWLEDDYEADEASPEESTADAGSKP